MVKPIFPKQGVYSLLGGGPRGRVPGKGSQGRLSWGRGPSEGGQGGDLRGRLPGRGSVPMRSREGGPGMVMGSSGGKVPGMGPRA